MNTIQIDDKLVQVVNLNLETVISLPENVVYCFLNDDLKHFQVYSSKCMISHLGRLLEAIKVSGEYSVVREEMRSIKICILETNLETKDLKLRQSFWRDWFKSRNFIEYLEITPHRYVLETNLVYEDRGRLVYTLSAVNKHDTKELGRFRTKKSLNEFVKKHYPSGKVYKFVYATPPVVGGSGDS